MRTKAKCANNISIIFFLFSSSSLLVIPFTKINDELTTVAYCTAGVFWIGLILGIAFQVMASVMSKKLKKKKTPKLRRMMIPIGVFSVLLVLILLIGKKSIILLSVDLALLLMSIELYIYLRRRYEL